MDCKERENFWKTLRSGYKILFATTAKRGLSMLSDNVDLVFLSIELPDMNSMDALRLIKNKYPATAVITIASCGTEETCVKTLGRGTMGYIKKTLEAEDILQEIKTLIDLKDVSPQRSPASLSAENSPVEHFPDVPSHLISGVLRVRDFVSQNYSGSLSLSAACRMASMSKTYFCHFFKHVTGHSLRSFHHIVKVRAAQELLRDKRSSIKDVARELGYSDPNYFSTIYKKVTGVPPKQRHLSTQS